MRPWVSRLTSVIVVLALSGSPVTLVACVAACLGAHDAHVDDRPSARPHCESTPADVGTSLTAPCYDCCSASSSVAATTGRPDRHAVNTVRAAASSEALPLPVISRLLAIRGPIAAVSPPPPISASIPLRI